MSIILPKFRNQFKVVLDSYDTASYSGRQFDATFIVDFNRIVMSVADLDKSYAMSIVFRSRENTHGSQLFPNTDVYQLAIDLGKGINCVSNRNQYNICGLLQVGNGFTDYTSTKAPNYIYCLDQDNAPALIKNLNSINNIRVSVIQSSNNAIFNAIDDNTTNTATKYVCILTFTEL